MKTVKFSSYNEVAMDDNEFSEFLNASEIDLVSDIQWLKLSFELKHQKIQLILKNKKLQLNSINSYDKYHHTIKKFISKLKLKSFYCTQAINKLDDVLQKENEITQLFQLPNMRKQDQNVDYEIQNDQILINQRNDEDFIEALIHQNQIAFENIPIVLKYIKDQYISRLQRAFFSMNPKRHKEEDLLIFILSDIANVGEYHEIISKKE